jgi:hypothetical protein
MSVDSNELARLVGKTLADETLRDAFARLQIPWLPQIQPPAHNDWLTFGNVEFGFEDYAYFHALDGAGNQPPVLEQVCFYAPRGESAARIPPPMNLEYGLRRAQVRQLLDGTSPTRRLRKRDVYEYAEFRLVAAYDPAEGLDSVLILATGRGERPSAAQPPLGFTELRSYFDRPWHDPALRSRLYPLAESEAELGQIKYHGICDLVKRAGLRLLFHRVAETSVLIGAEIFRSRVHDAAKWEGDLPFGLAFTDSVDDISRKVGSAPVSEDEKDLEGDAMWSIDGFRLVVVFDLILNLIATITLARAERWDIES